jgi:hypothetical protein
MAGSPTPLWTGTGDCSINQLYLELAYKNGYLLVYNFGRHLATLWDTALLGSGKPGVSGYNMPSNSTMWRADLDYLEYGNPVQPQGNVGVTTTPTRVDFQFGGTVDDSAGKGMSYYMLYRAPYGSVAYAPIGELVTSFGRSSMGPGVRRRTQSRGVGCFMTTRGMW